MQITQGYPFRVGVEVRVLCGYGYGYGYSYGYSYDYGYGYGYGYSCGYLGSTHHSNTNPSVSRGGFNHGLSRLQLAALLCLLDDGDGKSILY